MRSPLLLFVVAAPPLLLPMLLALPASAQVTTRRPRLSEAIRTTIEKDGAEAARRRYQEIAQNRRDEYEFDIKALVDLGSAYIQRGDVEKGQMIFGIATEAALLASGVSLPESATAARRPAPTPARRVGEEEAARRRSLEALGPGRDDLARFHGVYGDPAQQRTPRNFFVDQSCEGHLRLGAMWGDVAPWVMKSVSDAEFVQGWTGPEQRTPIRLQFTVGRDGRAQALTHNMAELGQPLRVVRLGDLPETFVSDCRDRAP